MANYLKIIGEYFPSADVTLTGIDPTVYSAIVWNTTAIAQATLDQYADRLTMDLRYTYSNNVDGIMKGVINTSGSTIAAGTPVYATGTDALTGKPTVGVADSAVLAKLPAIGITVASIANSATGMICTGGVLKDVVNTSTYSAGDMLYVGSGGGITNVKPSSTSQWQQIGQVNEVSTLGDIIVSLQRQENMFTQRSIDVTMHGSTLAYYKSSTSLSWTTVTRLAFRGSDIFGTPLATKAVCWISQSSKTGQVRLYDITNSKVMATSATFNNTTAAIIDLGTITNVPTSNAIIEFQVLSSSSTNTVYISSGHIYFN